MPSLRAYNNIECIKFNAGIIPDTDSLIDQWPSRSSRAPPLPIEEAPEDPENRLAWIINSYGHHYAKSYAYHRFREEPVPEIDTWVIGKPIRDDAVFASWFDDVPDSYKVLIHRAPPNYAGEEHPAFAVWERTHGNLGIKTGRTVSNEMRSSVRTVLEDVLTQYSISEGDPRPIIESLGHEVGYSNTIPYL